ncbi:Tn3 family transposase [Nonomuraea sp. NPDC051191]|uniref:Tn3 family transposase n=1 Tax=Nonomuraea sp. NPDC051191 TaxID=3364372 RepID=UPI0037B4E4F2
MPVEFLSDEQAAGFASFQGPPTRVQLEKYFFLDDADREAIDTKRRDHNRLGFAVQLGVARLLRRFLPDPRQVPAEVVDYLAQQLGITDPSCIKLDGQRDGTARTHAGEIEKASGWIDFAEVEPGLARWIAARAFTTGEGPKALFDAAVAELRSRPVLMPGVHRLARLVAREREKATKRLWDSLYDLLNDEQRRVLAELVEVPAGARISTLERLRRPVVKASGPQMERALERVAEIAALGVGEVDVSVIPPRRMAELWRYGMDGKATLIDRHGAERKLATLLATVVHLTTRSVDDALDLLDLLIATRLLARAERESSKEKLRTLPRVERASATLAEAVRVLIEATDDQVDVATGEILAPGLASIDEVWAAIEAVVSRQQLTAALEAIIELTPPADSDADEAWRAMLVGCFAMVRPFLPQLCEVIQFGATAEGRPVLAALRTLPSLMGRKRVTPEEINASLLIGSWRRLVLRAPHLQEGQVDWKAYAFCVLEQFHRLLRRREIFAINSSKWGDPGAKLLQGPVWEALRPTVLASLRLPEQPGTYLTRQAETLDAAYREVAGRLPANTSAGMGDDGRLHLAALEPVPEPDSLVALREAVEAMMPRVDLPEVLLEVFSWTGADAAFTSITGEAARLADLPISIAALLVAHGCNVGMTPVIGGAKALRRDRLSHVDQTYLRLATYKAANATLIDAQAGIGLAQVWGGGPVASVDGMRFVVPTATIHARPNPKYFGRGRGATWLNMLNDQASGLGGMVVAGTPRDSLYVLDVLYDRDGGKRPEMIVTDTASYSDIVYGLLTLAGFSYAPQLADLPDQNPRAREHAGPLLLRPARAAGRVATAG